MARRFSPIATAPPSGGHTGANTPGTPAGPSHTLAVGKTAAHRKKKGARRKHHSGKRRG